MTDFARPGPIIRYFGELNRKTVGQLVELIGTDADPNRIAFVFLRTPGGDAHAAYQLGRFLQRRFAGYVLIVDGYCKSAGTVFALGAVQVLFTPLSELGPIDVQLPRKDEIAGYESGLETVLSTTAIIDFTFSTFEALLLKTVARSGGAISSKMAAGIAAEVAGTLGSQLASQLDPVWLGRVHRALAIAQEYGRRLDCGNVKEGAISNLMTGYPDHGFVIDVDEARSLFRNVEVCAAPFQSLLHALDGDIEYVRAEDADEIWDKTGVSAAYAAAAANALSDEAIAAAEAAEAAAEAAVEAATEAAEAVEVAKTAETTAAEVADKAREASQAPLPKGEDTDESATPGSGSDD